MRERSATVDRLLAAFSLVLSLGAAVAPPAAYYAFAHRYAEGSLETEVADAARDTTRLVSANPTMWRFETVRLRELLSQRPTGREPEARRLVDLEGATVVEVVDPLEGPLLRRSGPVLDAGVVVARLEISRSLRPPLLRALALFLVLLPVAAATYVLLRLLPARAIARAEEARRRFEEQARHHQRLEAVGRLAGGVAHDFNNLLSAILGFGRALQEELAVGTSQRELADEIVSAARRGAQVTRSLLAFSRRQDLELHRIDVNDLLRRAEPLLRSTVGQRAELRLRLEPQPLPVLADGVQLELVLLNLVSNARDALGPTGRVDLATERIEVGERGDPGRPLRPGLWASLSVTDTGSGMDPATQQRIFDPFFTTKEVGKGTGLGLSMAHGVLRQHGGAIQVVSAPGQGSRFTLYLPLATGGSVQPSLFTEEGLTGETPATGTPIIPDARRRPH